MGHPKSAEDFYVAVQDSENAWAEDEYLRIFARGMDIFFFFWPRVRIKGRKQEATIRILWNSSI